MEAEERLGTQPQRRESFEFPIVIDPATSARLCPRGAAGRCICCCRCRLERSVITDTSAPASRSFDAPLRRPAQPTNTFAGDAEDDDVEAPYSGPSTTRKRALRHSYTPRPAVRDTSCFRSLLIHPTTRRPVACCTARCMERHCRVVAGQSYSSSSLYLFHSHNAVK